MWRDSVVVVEGNMEDDMTPLNYLTDTIEFLAIVAMCAALYWVG